MTSAPAEGDDVGMSEVERGEALDLARLSPRELEVLDAAIEGLSARDIAGRLSLTEATVRSHLSAIYSKLGVAGRVELLARLNGAVAPRSAPVAEPESPSVGPRANVPHGGHRRRLVGGASVLLLAVCAAVVFFATRPDLPPRSDLDTVSRLLAANEITLLDLHGETLTVTERSGETVRVEGVTAARFQPIERVALANGVALSASSDSWSLATELAMMAGALLPLLLLLAVLLLVARAIRRPPRVRPAG
jgi:DNA-binding CsgD family transcriptional regulator